MTKREMILKWHDEDAKPISRCEAARIIRGNRRRAKEDVELRIVVARKYKETYITSDVLQVGCCIGRA